jgi:hypothetical protein
MSDTPRTDAMEIELRLTYDDVAFVRFARELERENAALREVFAKAELLSDPAVAEGDYEYVEFCGYFRPNEIIVVMDRAALDAARAKEDQP